MKRFLAVPNAEDLSLSHKEGYMDKKSRSIFGNWLQRFYQVQDHILVYYEDHEKLNRKGEIFIKKIKNLNPIGIKEFEFDYDDRKY